jgi:hypothetical protein
MENEERKVVGRVEEVEVSVLANKEKIKSILAQDMRERNELIPSRHTWLLFHHRSSYWDLRDQ